MQQPNEITFLNELSTIHVATQKDT